MQENLPKEEFIRRAELAKIVNGFLALMRNKELIDTPTYWKLHDVGIPIFMKFAKDARDGNLTKIED